MQVLIPASLRQLEHAIVEAGGAPVTTAGGPYDAALVDLASPDAQEDLRCLVPATRVIVVAARREQDLVLEALLAGARDFVNPPLDVAVQLERAFRELDNGTPAAFMERLVGYHELGAMVMRQKLVARDLLELSRREVKEGRWPNLFEALKSYAPEQELIEVLEQGHKLVSMAFLLMKTRTITMQQLRAAFVFTRNRNKRLDDALEELKLVTREQILGAMKLVPPNPDDDPPPPASMALRRPR